MLDIIKDPKKLKIRSEDFDFNHPPFEPSKFAHELVETMYDINGLGLAANQVGYLYQIFAFRGPEKNFVLFNPRITSYSDERIVLEEGCLSFPGIFLKIERPQHIRIRFQGPSGEWAVHKFTGETAKICQHEIEHLDGKLFTYNVSKFKLWRALDKASKLGYDYIIGDLTE